MRRKPNRAFTLIELLLVLMILSILAIVVVPKYFGRVEDSRIKAARGEVSNIKTAISTFEVDTGRLPTSDEGLRALVERPGDLQGWKSSYIDKVPVDPWGHEYVYRCPGTNGKDFDLLSCGPDGHEGGGDDVEP